MKVYTTLDDYMLENIPYNYGDLELTEEQREEVADRMTEWHDEVLPDGNIWANDTGFVEREDVEFWEVLKEVLEETEED